MPPPQRRRRRATQGQGLLSQVFNLITLPLKLVFGGFKSLFSMFGSKAKKPAEAQKQKANTPLPQQQEEVVKPKKPEKETATPLSIQENEGQKAGKESLGGLPKPPTPTTRNNKRKAPSIPSSDGNIKARNEAGGLDAMMKAMMGGAGTPPQKKAQKAPPSNTPAENPMAGLMEMMGRGKPPQKKQKVEPKDDLSALMKLIGDDGKSGNKPQAPSGLPIAPNRNPQRSM